MKRTFLKFAAPISTRRFRMDGHTRNTAYRSHGTDGGDDDDDEDEDEDEGASKEARLIKKIQTRMAKSLKGYATKQEIADMKATGASALEGVSLDALKAMTDEKEGVMSILAKQGLEMQRLTKQIAEQPKDMSIRSQCAAWIEANKDAITKVRNRQAKELPEFELQMETRALASPMLPSTVAPGGTAFINRYEVAPGVVGELRLEPTFWDYIKKGSTSSETYIWVNKKPTEGAAAWLAPGQLKPGISFTFNTEISNAKKIADSAKMATELLQDIEGFASWVETELRFKVMEKVNATLMTGVASTTVPAGIQTLSVPFNAGLGLETTNANGWDAIRALVAQLRATKFKGVITVFMNSIDIANMVMTKAQNQGQQFIMPVTGAVIVEDENIPQGYIQAAALDYYKILIYKAFSISWGWENDDFTRNLVTALGEMRLHQFHSENHDGFAIYDTIENIIAGITPVIVP